MGKVIDITIRAKDVTAKAWRSIQASAKRFSRRLKSTFSAAARGARVVASAVTAMAAATVAAAGVVVNAYRKQESAEKDLEAALRAHGDAADALLPKLKRNAAAIQDQTGIADESTLALMAQIRNLGVQGDALDQAAKNAIGLAKALKLDSNAAARYTALAMKGEFTILQRYVPALRTATSESEKNAIVTDLMRKGYEQAQMTLNTTAGRWAELKGRIGDTLEKIGEAIVKGANLRGIMASWSEKIKDFQDSEAFQTIVEKIQSMVEGATTLVDIISKGGKGRGEVVGAMGVVIKEAFATGADKAVKVLVSGAKYIGTLIGAAAKKAMSGESLRAFARRDAEALGSMVADGLISKTKAYFPATLLSAEEEAERVRRRNAIKARQLQEDLDAETNDGDEKTSLQVALENLKAVIEENKTVVKETTVEVEKEKVAVEKLVELEKESTKEAEKRVKLAKDLAAAKKQLANNEKQDQIQDEQNKARAADADAQQIQGEIDKIKNRRQAEQEQKEEARLQRREEELMGRKMRGTKLGPKAEEFLKRRDLERQLANAQENKRLADKTAQEMAVQVAELQRREANQLLRDQIALLTDNLQAAAVG